MQNKLNTVEFKLRKEYLNSDGQQFHQYQVY
jgi:ABC-type transport system substrate-binding protein